MMAGSKLRRTTQGYAHWCPACREMHHIWTPRWSFDGNLAAPTFNPSVKITGKQIEIGPDDRWTGKWLRDAAGNALDKCCHYFLHGGVLKFCGDSKHALAGKNVPLPDIPAHISDYK